MNPILDTLPKAKTWSLVLAIVLIMMAVGSFITVIMPIIFILLAVFLFQFRGACKRLEVSQHSNDLLDVCKAQKRFLVTQGVFSILMVVVSVLGVLAAIAIPAYSTYFMR